MSTIFERTEADSWCLIMASMGYDGWVEKTPPSHFAIWCKSAGLLFHSETELKAWLSLRWAADRVERE